MLMWCRVGGHGSVPKALMRRANVRWVGLSSGTLRSGSIIAVRLSTISASSVDLGGQLNLQSAPARYDHVASVSIGRQVLLAHEGSEQASGP